MGLIGSRTEKPIDETVYQLCQWVGNEWKRLPEATQTRREESFTGYWLDERRTGFAPLALCASVVLEDSDRLFVLGLPGDAISQTLSVRRATAHRLDIDMQSLLARMPSSWACTCFQEPKEARSFFNQGAYNMFPVPLFLCTQRTDHLFQFKARLFFPLYFPSTEALCKILRRHLVSKHESMGLDSVLAKAITLDRPIWSVTMSRGPTGPDSSAATCLRLSLTDADMQIWDDKQIQAMNDLCRDYASGMWGPVTEAQRSSWIVMHWAQVVWEAIDRWKSSLLNTEPSESEKNDKRYGVSIREMERRLSQRYKKIDMKAILEQRLNVRRARQDKPHIYFALTPAPPPSTRPSGWGASRSASRSSSCTRRSSVGSVDATGGFVLSPHRPETPVGVRERPLTPVLSRPKQQWSSIKARTRRSQSVGSDHQVMWQWTAHEMKHGRDFDDSFDFASSSPLVSISEQEVGLQLDSATTTPVDCSKPRTQWPV